MRCCGYISIMLCLETGMIKESRQIFDWNCNLLLEFTKCLIATCVRTEQNGCRTDIVMTSDCLVIGWIRSRGLNNGLWLDLPAESLLYLASSVLSCSVVQCSIPLYLRHRKVSSFRMPSSALWVSFTDFSWSAAKHHWENRSLFNFRIIRPHFSTVPQFAKFLSRIVHCDEHLIETTKVLRCFRISFKPLLRIKSCRNRWCSSGAIS